MTGELSPTPGEKRTVATLVSLLTLGLVDAQLLSPILTEIAASLDTSPEDIGRTVIGYAICAALAALIAGPVSDHTGRGRFLIGAGCVFALGSLLVVASGSLRVFVVARMVTGAAAGVISALTVAAIADSVPYERRGRAMGWVGMAYAAPVVAIPVAAKIAEQDWTTIYLVFTFGASLVAVAVALWFDEPQIRASGSSRSPGYLRFMRARSTAAGALSAFFVTGGLTGFLLFLGAHLRTEIGLSLSSVSYVFSLSGLAGLFGALAAGRLSDHIGKTRVALAGSTAMVVFLVVVPATAGFVMYAALGMVGLSAATRVAPLQSLVTQLVTSEHRGAFVALRNTLSQCGNATAAYLASMLYPLGFQYICWLTAGFSAVAVVLILLIEEPEQDKE